jgi:uncharacterized membrane protein YphA (DoxX/SURF4 family)
MLVKPDFKGIVRNKHWIGVGAGLILGLIFIVAGLGKLLHQPDTVRIFFIPLPYFLTQAMAKAVLNWLPVIELTIGFLLVVGIAPKLVATFSTVLIIGFITHSSLLIGRGLGSEPCDCFGKRKIVPYTELSVIGSLYFDIVMLVLVFIILFWYKSNFLNIRPWFLAKSKIIEKY